MILFTLTTTETKSIATRTERRAALRDVCPEPLSVADGEIALRHTPSIGYALEGPEAAVSRLLVAMKANKDRSGMRRELRGV